MNELNSIQKLLKAQQEIGAIKKESKNPFYKSKYFDINAILAEVKPILNKNGLLLLQPLVVIDGKNCIRTVIVDSDTEAVVIESTCVLPDSVDPQKSGSAVTYFRRYALQSTLGLEAEDDDGNVASGMKPSGRLKVADDDVSKEVYTNAPPF